MSKKRRKKGALVLIVLLIIISIVLYVFLFKSSSKSKVIDEIKAFNYTLDDRDTDLMKEKFNDLKNILSSKEIDYEKYAETISSLFVIDLYTINNKLSKYDVGGSEYIYPDHVENYKLKVEDTLYKYVEEKSSRKKKSDLPIVSSIKINEVETDEYKYGEKKYNAYKVDLSWDYKKDLGYDTEAEIVLIKVEDKLYIAEFTTEVAE